MNNYTKCQLSPRVIQVRFDNIAAGWEQYILLISDNHHDSPYCNRKLEKAHLDLAKERGALILFGGDVFDAMNGKYDPRRSLDDVRPEDKGANYLDRIVEHAADDFSAYVENILAIGMGNHEATVLNNSGTNITSNLVHHLNSKHGGSILTMGIKCWIQFYFKIQKTVGLSKTIRYHHGADGSAPVTKGAIHTNRQAVYLPDADVVWNGHNHNEYYIPLARERISQQGVELTDIIHFVRTPGYKDEINMRDAKKFDVTYSDIKNFSPTPKGCAFLRFYYNGKSSIEIDVMCIAK